MIEDCSPMEEEAEGDFDHIIVEILEAEEKGHRIPRETWCDLYPHYAREIEEFFTDQSFLQQYNQSVADSFLPEIRGFKLKRIIGRGGYGVVYEAEQADPHRIVALKAMVGARFHTPIGRVRFRREANASARLDHPHILPVFGSGESEGVPYFTMKLAVGGPLSRALDRYRNNPQAAAELLVNLARATHHAHQRGILHRDLKPSNVLLDETGIGYLSDFGLFRNLLEEDPLTLSSELIGTIPYMAPESLDASKPQTIVLDVYGLGGILYACLTGKAPFEKKNDAETLLAVKSDLPVPPQKLNSRIPADLNAICLKCLEKEPTKRYSSAEALAEDLTNYLQGRPTIARPPGTIRRVANLINRHPLQTTALGLVIYLVASTAIGLMLHHVRLQNLNEQLVQKNIALKTEHDLVEAKSRELRERTHIDQLRYAYLMLKAGDREELIRVLERALPEELEQGGPSFTWKYLRHSAEQEFASLTINEKEAYGVEFSKDSKRLIASGQDGTIRFIDTATYSQRINREHHEETNATAHSPDGTKLATTSDDKTVRIWDSSSEKVIHVLEGHEGVVDEVAWKDNQTLYTAGRDGMIWEWKIGKKLSKQLIHQMGKEESKKNISFDFKLNRAIIVDRGGNAHSVNLRTKKRAHLHFDVNSLIDQVFSDPLTGRIAILTQNGSLRIGEEGKTELAGPGQKIDSLAWHPHESLLVTATRDGAISFWDVNAAKLSCRIPGHPGKIWGMTFDPQGKVLATVGADSKLRMWNVEDILRRQLSVTHSTLDDFAFGQRGEPYLYTSRNNGVDQLDLNAMKVVQTSPDFSSLPLKPALKSDIPRLLEISPNSDFLVCVCQGRSVLCLDLPTFKLRWAQRVPGAISDLRIASTGQQIWCIDEKGMIRSLDVGRGDFISQRDSGFLNDIRLHPYKPLIASLNTKQELEIFDSQSFQVLRHLPQSEDHSYKYFSFSPDGSFVVAGGSNRIVLWDWENDVVTHEISGQGQGLSQLEFSPDGLEFAALFRDGTIRIWRTQSAQQLLQLNAPEGSVGPDMAFSRDGSILLRRTRFHSEQHVQRFCAYPCGRPSGWPVKSN